MAPNSSVILMYPLPDKTSLPFPHKGLVSVPVSWRVHCSSKNLHLWVLPEVYEGNIDFSKSWYVKFYSAQASSVMKRHAQKCVWKHPPGDEIYRKDKLSVFEVGVLLLKYIHHCLLRCVVRSTSNTVRTFVWSPSLSSTTRLSTTTSSRSSSTWWPPPTPTAATLLGTSARRRTASSTTTSPVSSHFLLTRWYR